MKAMDKINKKLSNNIDRLINSQDICVKYARSMYLNNIHEGESQAVIFESCRELFQAEKELRYYMFLKNTWCDISNKFLFVIDEKLGKNYDIRYDVICISPIVIINDRILKLENIDISDEKNSSGLTRVHLSFLKDEYGKEKLGKDITIACEITDTICQELTDFLDILKTKLKTVDEIFIKDKSSIEKFENEKLIDNVRDLPPDRYLINTSGQVFDSYTSSEIIPYIVNGERFVILKSLTGMDTAFSAPKLMVKTFLSHLIPEWVTDIYLSILYKDCNCFNCDINNIEPVLNVDEGIYRYISMDELKLIEGCIDELGTENMEELKNLCFETTGKDIGLTHLIKICDLKRRNT